MWQTARLVGPAGVGRESGPPLAGLLAESEESVYREVS